MAEASANTVVTWLSLIKAGQSHAAAPLGAAMARIAGCEDKMVGPGIVSFCLIKLEINYIQFLKSQCVELTETDAHSELDLSS